MILKNIQMKNKQIARSRWERRELVPLQILPRGPVIRTSHPQKFNIISVSICVGLCVLLSDSIRTYVCVCVFRGGGRGQVSEGRRRRREKERRDGWGQFGGSGCFNYPLLCRWVRARYLSPALSLSHDLSSTFIPKPSARLAKQRKKGGQRWGFTAVTMPRLPLISLNLRFLCTAHHSNLNKVTPARPAGVWIWLLGWGVLLHLGRAGLAPLKSWS